MALTKEQFGRRRHRLMRGPSGETYDDAALQPAPVIRDERPLLCPPDPAGHPRMIDIVLQNVGNDGPLPRVNMKNAAQGFLLPERRSGLSFLKNVI